MAANEINSDITRNPGQAAGSYNRGAGGALTWGAGSAGVFPDRETRREIARERAAAARTEKKRMFAIYVALVVVTTAFGIVAAYHWERGKDAAANAAVVAAQNDSLAARITELESLSEGLADMVALAFERNPQDLLAQLSDLEDRRPEAADTTIFAKLWIGAKDRETQNQGGFETASGGDPTKLDLAKPNAAVSEPVQSEPTKSESAKPEPAKADPAKTETAKSEPSPQDRAKGDQIKPEPVQTDQAKSDQAKLDPAGDNQARGREQVRVERSDANLRQSDIAIRAIAESWIQIVDGSGRPTFTKLLKGGDVHRLSPPPDTTLITGNPTGLELTVDGAVAPPFNAKGPTRREIVLDPDRLLEGTAEQPAKARATPP